MVENLVKILVLSVALGGSSFVIGSLPLSLPFSATYRIQLSTFGNGLLLGAALGIIIPEGMQAAYQANESNEGHTSVVSQVALSIMIGFTIMLIIEQYLTGHSHSQHIPVASEEIFRAPSPTENIGVEEYDLGTMDLENLQPRKSMARTPANSSAPTGLSAYPLTLGLAIHSLADGLALGASTADSENSTLSLVVFLALCIHKAPAALALGSQLMTTSLSRYQIRRHIAIFSAATPVGTIASFFLLNLLGTDAGKWTGIAMLISGGSFLYVATVIQPVGAHSHDHGDSLATEELPKLQRLLLLVGGIFLPFIISSVFGHGHVEGTNAHQHAL
ncbi:hypothetical protein M422DRAFT_24647 [Sphaerobolus stellatus SS14]|nr:hypothetical protein M422DRAFT_24647 [Sphaerobolus stellatus SS14]